MKAAVTLNSRKAGLPRYLEIAAALRRQLASGRWKPGDRLPSIAAFADEYGVTAVTAREAIKLVESKGMIECRRGSGTFVATPVIQLHSVALRPDLASIGELLREVAPIRLPVPADDDAPEVPTGLAAAPDYHRMWRLVIRDGQPLMFAKVWLDARLYHRASERFDNEVVMTVLADLTGFHGIRRWRQRLTIDVAGPEIAMRLGRPPYAPVAEINVILADAADTAVYVGTMMLPAELIRVDFAGDEETAAVH